ncbi:MAG TPA: sulfur carrier protein ThiS [Gammaproteobacteria bacterium]
MQALVNGKPAELAEGTTVADLVCDLGLAKRRIAVELNGEILPRSRHATHVIAAGDVLEIVHAIGGGAMEHHRR